MSSGCVTCSRFAARKRKRGPQKPMRDPRRGRVLLFAPPPDQPNSSKHSLRLHRTAPPVQLRTFFRVEVEAAPAKAVDSP